MNPTTCPPVLDFASIGDQASWLKELPKILALPGGFLMVNYLLLQATRLLRSAVAHSETILEAPWYPGLPSEHRMEAAVATQQNTETVRANIEQLKTIARPGFLMSFLINQCDELLIRLSDLSETLAISADPEMLTLSKELSNVL